MKKLSIKAQNSFKLFVFASVEAAWFYTNGEPLGKIPNTVQYDIDVNDTIELEWLGSEFDYADSSTKSFSLIRGVLKKPCLYNQFMIELLYGWVPTSFLSSQKDYIITNEASSINIDEYFTDMLTKLANTSKTQKNSTNLRN